MGLELKTTATKGKSNVLGKLHLDSKQLTFSGADLKWKVDLGPEVKAVAKGTQLIVSKGRDKVSFEIGDNPQRWVKKILNPPSRLDKLGVKPGIACWLSNGFTSAFKSELRAGGAKVVRKLESCGLAFFRIDDRDQLGDLLETCDQLEDRINVWVVYPKGVESITQGDVMGTMKNIDFGPSKNAAFDEQLSSMRYARRN